MPVLKTLSRRHLSAYRFTLDYITKKGTEPILHNIRSSKHDAKGIVDEFVRNEAYRKANASNTVRCYHSIVSLSYLDKDNVTPEMMNSLARKYFELRGDILGVAVAHLDDTDSPHIHILESGNRYREDKASGIRKHEFHNLKLELEKFVEEELKLKNSRVIHGSGKTYIKEAEYQLQKRTGNSEKEQLRTLVYQAYNSATSKQQFLNGLLDHGYMHYERTDGVLTGIVSKSGRKFRFKTLGLSPDQLLALESTQEKQQEKQLLDRLNQIRNHHHSKSKEL